MKRLPLWAAAAALAIATVAAGRTQRIAKIEKVEFPGCQPVRAASPDGRWVLVSAAPGVNCPAAVNISAASASANDYGVELYLEDAQLHRRQPVPFEGYDGEAAWSPSGEAFFVNDHYGSNGAVASLYLPATLHRIDLADAIHRADSNAMRYFDGHSYIWALDWIDGRTALVQLCGHTDTANGVQFNFRYKVGLDGRAQRIASQVRRPDPRHPDCE